MTTIALSGNDTIIINNRIYTDLATGNVVEITLPNEIAKVKTGKNGNSVYAQDFSGLVVDVKLILVRGSGDDKFTNQLLSLQNLNFQGATLLVGQFIKYIGDGQGGITNDVYTLSGGIFSKQVGARTNTDGEVEQSQVEYMMKFSNLGLSVRSLV